jgi:hypothetical protein
MGHPIAYFSEKLNDARNWYSTYDLELYALVQTIKHWRHYLIHQEFLLFTDHDSQRHLNDQKKHNARHARWVNYLQQFTFVLRHKAGVDNTVADALSRTSLILSQLSTDITCFEAIKEAYSTDPDFGTCYKTLLNSPSRIDGHYSLFNGYLFKGTQFVFPIHAGGLAGHFGHDKTIALVEDRFYWLHLKCDVFTVLKRCRTCQLSKGTKMNAGLYSPFQINHGVILVWISFSSFLERCVVMIPSLLW